MNKKGNVLIVDDELIVRDSLGKWFREEGYGVGTAESAREALALLARQDWDVALVDIKSLSVNTYRLTPADHGCGQSQ